MNKYIDAEKLKAEIQKKYLDAKEKARFAGETGTSSDCTKWDAIVLQYENVLRIIESLQQEQPEDKQIVIITESHGDANIEWDCRSLDDVIALLKSAESFIAEKQIEKIAGHGSGPDYATTEGRYSQLFKPQQEQPEVDLEKQIDTFLNETGAPYVWCNDDEQKEWCNIIARHFYGLRNRALEEAARHVYESWMGGTMDDVRRDMVELGKVLNARKP